MITFFKPNRSTTGSLASFKVLSKQNKPGEPFKEGCVYLQLVRQSGWDDKRKTGSFKDGEQINVKLNSTEVSDIIYAIENNDKFSSYHDGYNQTTQISFQPWVDKGSGKNVGFGLFVNKKSDDGDSNIKIGFKFGESVKLREYLKFSLEHIFSALYAEEKRKFKEHLERTQGEDSGGSTDDDPLFD